MARWLLIALALMTAACGSDAPSAPTPPPIAQVAGVWTGNVTQTVATGGPECLALFQLGNGGSAPFTLAVTQAGSALTATASAQATGQSCSYTGTAGSTTVSLNATACQPQGFQVTCNFVPRDVILLSRSVTATVTLNTMSGTSGESWNVFPRGATTGGIGIVIVNYTFSFTR